MQNTDISRDAGAPSPALSVRDLRAWYDESQALHGVSFDVFPSEVVTLLGRNGAGKTTTLRAIMGLVKKRSGSITFNGSEIINLTPRRVARHGVGYCPEERGIFASLTVAENLTLPPKISDEGLAAAEITALFPNLANRDRTPGTRLSGGEQQMLSIARILRAGSKFLLLDEPTEGLAPVIVQEIGNAIKTLKTRGFTILLVEQSLDFATYLADRHYVIENGMIIEEFSRQDLEHDPAPLRKHLMI